MTVERVTENTTQQYKNILKMYKKAVKRHRSVETLKCTSKRELKE
jgi:hypothetical protein